MRKMLPSEKIVLKTGDFSVTVIEPMVGRQLYTVTVHSERIDRLTVHNSLDEAMLSLMAMISKEDENGQAK